MVGAVQGEVAQRGNRPGTSTQASKPCQWSVPAYNNLDIFACAVYLDGQLLENQAERGIVVATDRFTGTDRRC